MVEEKTELPQAWGRWPTRNGPVSLLKPGFFSGGTFLECRSKGTWLSLSENIRSRDDPIKEGGTVGQGKDRRPQVGKRPRGGLRSLKRGVEGKRVTSPLERQICKDCTYICKQGKKNCKVGATFSRRRRQDTPVRSKSIKEQEERKNILLKGWLE